MLNEPEKLHRLYGRKFETSDGKPPPGVKNPPCLAFRTEPMTEADCHEALMDLRASAEHEGFEFVIVEADAEPVFPETQNEPSSATATTGGKSP